MQLHGFLFFFVSCSCRQYSHHHVNPGQDPNHSPDRKRTVRNGTTKKERQNNFQDNHKEAQANGGIKQAERAKE